MKNFKELNYYECVDIKKKYLINNLNINEDEHDLPFIAPYSWRIERDSKNNRFYEEVLNVVNNSIKIEIKKFPLFKRIFRKYNIKKNNHGYVYSITIECDNYTKSKIYVDILDDEWFLVASNSYYFHCDGIDGLKECIQYIINLQLENIHKNKFINVIKYCYYITSKIKMYMNFMKMIFYRLCKP